MGEKQKIAVLPGDAIGPEIMTQALRALEVIEELGRAKFEIFTADFGANAYFKHGKAFPREAQLICDQADAILKGPVGLSYEESQKIPVEEQPERGAILPLGRGITPLPIFNKCSRSAEMSLLSS